MLSISPLGESSLGWGESLMHGGQTPVIRGCLGERGSQGLSPPETEGRLSMRASVTGEIVLDDVRCVLVVLVGAPCYPPARTRTPAASL